MFYSTSLSNELPLVDFEGNTRADNSGFENTGT
jgi:hypothetical protein